MPKKKILIVEDNAMNRMILSGILTSALIYEVAEASNGQEALEVDVYKRQLPAIRVLLADDDPDTCLSAAEFLKTMGAVVDVAFNGPVSYTHLDNSRVCPTEKDVPCCFLGR